MKNIRLLLFACLPLTAQIAIVNSVTVTATAQTPATTVAAVCTFTGASPAMPNGISLSCSIGGVTYLTQTQIVPIGETITGSFTAPQGVITWSITQTSQSGPVAYTITETPTGGVSTSSSGTF